MRSTAPLAPDDAGRRRAELRSLVSELDPIDELERQHQDEVLTWIDSGAPLHRTAKPATPPQHLVSYSVVIDPSAASILLVDHRLAQRWLPTGGHVEPGEAPEHAARRELAEELALSIDFWPPSGDRPLFLTRNRTGGLSTPHTDVSLWYVFTTSQQAPVQIDEREFVGARWWHLDEIVEAEAAGVRFDQHLTRFAAKLERHGLTPE